MLRAVSCRRVPNIERAEVALLSRRIVVIAGNVTHGGHVMAMGAIVRQAYDGINLQLSCCVNS
jgi:hypothetical protein